MCDEFAQSGWNILWRGMDGWMNIKLTGLLHRVDQKNEKQEFDNSNETRK